MNYIKYGLPAWYSQVHRKQTDPGASDSGYAIGDIWVNEVTDKGFLCLDNSTGAAVWGEAAAGSGGTPHTVVSSTDATTNLALTDLNKIWVITNAGATTVNLPSIGSDDIGDWIQIHKAGAGDLTINRADADVIEDGTSVANTTAAQTWSNIRLFVSAATTWKFDGAPLGNWSTA